MSAVSVMRSIALEKTLTGLWQKNNWNSKCYSRIQRFVCSYLMAEPLNGLKKNAAAAEELKGVNHQINLKNRSIFNYYIHDSVTECRLQLLGDLTRAQVTELSGCWETARTTLGNRRLSLDVRRLKSADAEGKRWLEQMAKEGAVFMPETFLREAQVPTGKSTSETVAAIKLSLLGRVLGTFGRGARAESSDAAAVRAGDLS